MARGAPRLCRAGVEQGPIAFGGAGPPLLHRVGLRREQRVQHDGSDAVGAVAQQLQRQVTNGYFYLAIDIMSANSTPGRVLKMDICMRRIQWVCTRAPWATGLLPIVLSMKGHRGFRQMMSRS
jgi:hypothetical protein